MKIIRDISSIIVNDDIYINTCQYFNEDENTIVLRVAEYVPQFIRGFVCDMKFTFSLCDRFGNKIDDDHLNTETKDLVLVHIRKTVNITDIPEFEYVFYK